MTAHPPSWNAPLYSSDGVMIYRDQANAARIIAYDNRGMVMHMIIGALLFMAGLSVVYFSVKFEENLKALVSWIVGGAAFALVGISVLLLWRTMVVIDKSAGVVSTCYIFRTPGGGEFPFFNVNYDAIKFERIKILERFKGEDGGTDFWAVLYFNGSNNDGEKRVTLMIFEKYDDACVFALKMAEALGLKNTVLEPAPAYRDGREMEPEPELQVYGSGRKRDGGNNG